MTGIEPPSHWSATERAVWDALSAGRPADLDVIVGQEAPGVDDDENWAAAANRTLSKRFVEDLFSAAHAASLPRAVVFVGARFEDRMVFQDAPPVGLTFIRCHIRDLVLWGGRLGGPLRLDSSRIAGALWIGDAELGAGLTMKGGRVDNGFRLHRAVVNGPVLIWPGRIAGLDGSRDDKDDEPLHVAQDVDIDRTVLRDGVSVRGLQATGSLQITSCVVTGDVSVTNSDCSRLTLNKSQIAGALRLQDTGATRGFRFDNASISHDVTLVGLMGEAAVLSGETAVVGGGVLLINGRLPEGMMLDNASIRRDVVVSNVSADDESWLFMRAARVGGDLSIREWGGGRASLDSARVDGDIKIEGSAFAGRISATAVQVAGTLSLGNNDLADLDLTGATIGRDLSLLSWLGKEPRWKAGAQLSLRNATADAVRDSEDAWPGTLDLEGFTFKRTKSHDFAHEPLPARDSASLIAWLARDPNASAQPYVQLARVLREAGQVAKSNDILYAARQRERAEAWRGGHRWKAALMWLLETTVGYGLGPKRIFRAFWWVAGFVLAGVVVLHLDQHIHGHALAAKSRTLAWMFFASLDAMLPIVSLDSSFAAAVPARLVSIWSKSFFWVQGLVGWALGAFIAAGLAGLTQRPN